MAERESAEKRQKCPFYNGLMARTLWLHTLIHTPYAPDIACGLMFHARQLQTASTRSRRGVVACVTATSLSLDRSGEYPAARALARASADT